MRFEVLGPVRVVSDDGVLGPISSMRQRLLALLLVRANRVVSPDVISAALWGSEPPDYPAKSLQLHVHRLRQVLDRPDRLLSVPGGYLLELTSDELDASTFEAQLMVARGAVAEGEVARAARLLREAMELWRGAPYEGIDEPLVVEPEARGLAELRLIAVEEMYDAELAIGRSREIVPELTELVSEFPLRERFAGQLMLALYRSGRQARAIATYRAARRRIAEHLVTEPGRELRALHDAILAEDPELNKGESAPLSTSKAAVERVIPSQLPPATGAFFGRDAELSELEEATGFAEDSGAIVVTGMAGIGKTALAVRHAHRIADRFGDGQLYLDLRGHSPTPALDPMEALAALLRGLGSDPGNVPETLDDAIAEYRSRLAGRKMLVLLDNAASAEQVRPLLPAAPGCLALVTSRNRLSGLVARDGAQRIGLGVLTTDEAQALLTRLLGRARVDADSEGCAALIEACAGLPLALRIAAAQLADEPHWTFGDYLTELAATGLAVLTLDDDQLSAVAPAFDLSYQRLDPDVRRLFRLLGLVPGPDFTVAAAAALCRTTEPAARAAIRSLVSAHLLEEHTRGRYRFHDLLRDYAREKAETEDSPKSRNDAIGRICTWYFQGKEAAVAKFRSNQRTFLLPTLVEGISTVEISSRPEADAWVQAEFANIAALAASAAASAASSAGGETECARSWAWHLALGVGVELGRAGYLAGVRAMLQDAVDAARSAGDRQALAHAMAELGATQVIAGLTLADEFVAEALGHAQAAGDLGAEGFLLYVAGVARNLEARVAESDELLTRAVEIQRAAGDVGGQGLALNRLGINAARRGDGRAAVHWWKQILDTPAVGHFRSAESKLVFYALTNMCFTKVQLGWLEGIEELMGRAESLLDRWGDAASKSSFRVNQAIWHLDVGRFDEAVASALSATEIADDAVTPRYQAEARTALGLCYLGLGEPDVARVEFEEAAETASTGNLAEVRSDATLGIANCALASGDLVEARSMAEKAIEIAAPSNRTHIGLANITLARVALQLGETEPAIVHGSKAVELLEDRHYLGLARAHWVLGDGYAAVGDSAASAKQLGEALRMFEANEAPEAAAVRAQLP